MARPSYSDFDIPWQGNLKIRLMNNALYSTSHITTPLRLLIMISKYSICHVHVVIVIYYAMTGVNYRRCHVFGNQASFADQAFYCLVSNIAVKSMKAYLCFL